MSCNLQHDEFGLHFSTPANLRFETRSGDGLILVQIDQRQPLKLTAKRELGDLSGAVFYFTSSPLAALHVAEEMRTAKTILEVKIEANGEVIHRKAFPIAGLSKVVGLVVNRCKTR